MPVHASEPTGHYCQTRVGNTVLGLMGGLVLGNTASPVNPRCGGCRQGSRSALLMAPVANIGTEVKPARGEKHAGGPDHPIRQRLLSPISVMRPLLMSTFFSSYETATALSRSVADWIQDFHAGWINRYFKKRISRTSASKRPDRVPISTTEFPNISLFFRC